MQARRGQEGKHTLPLSRLRLHSRPPFTLGRLGPAAVPTARSGAQTIGLASRRGGAAPRGQSLRAGQPSTLLPLPPASPLIGAEVLVQPVLKGLVRGRGGALRRARGSATESEVGVATRGQQTPTRHHLGLREEILSGTHGHTSSIVQVTSRRGTTLGQRACALGRWTALRQDRAGRSCRAAQRLWAPVRSDRPWADA